MSNITTRPARLAHLLLVTTWFLVLMAPAITTFSSSHQWDVPPWLPLAISAWFFTSAWCLLGQRLFFLATWPVALISAVIVGADLLRHADLLELALARHPAHEVWDSVRPYVAPIVAAAVLLAAMAVAACRLLPVRGGHGLAGLLLAAAGLALAPVFPEGFARAWPLNSATLAVATALDRPDIASTLLPYALVDPRDHNASWNARRIGPVSPGKETYVLVIGETTRADRLHACGGTAGWRAPDPSRLVFCDVMASSSATHTSVPLLLSRELPGGPLRVSRDATFMKAFEQAGFHTVFLSVQEQMIAWPDAKEMQFLSFKGSDRESLLPAARETLRTAPDKLLLVLHIAGAHQLYCNRLKAGDTPLFEMDCGGMGDLPSDEVRGEWLKAYDNAVHESTRFLDELAVDLARRGGPVFTTYIADHGENLLDDERQLFLHALGYPTRWDTRVPMIVTANESWRKKNAAKWQKLASNQSHALVHADMVPTLLGAARIAYSDSRAGVTDLTSATPGKRTRLVLKRLGNAVDGDQLR